MAASTAAVSAGRYFTPISQAIAATNITKETKRKAIVILVRPAINPIVGKAAASPKR